MQHFYVFIQNVLYLLQYEDETFPRSPPGTLESIMGLAKEQLRAEQPFEDFEDDDFYCGSMGSTHSSSTHFQSLPNDKTSTLSTSIRKPRSHHNEGPSSLDHKRRTWHDYIDMGSGSPRHGRRSIPIRIEGHQYQEGSRPSLLITCNQSEPRPFT